MYGGASGETSTQSREQSSASQPCSAALFAHTSSVAPRLLDCAAASSLRRTAPHLAAQWLRCSCIKLLHVEWEQEWQNYISAQKRSSWRSRFGHSSDTESFNRSLC